MTDQPYIPDLPLGAWQAIRTKGDYEEEPDFDFSSYWYFYDSNNDWWTSACVNHDYIVRDGTPYYSTWLIWECGDVAIEDEVPLDSPDAEGRLIQKVEAERKKSRVAYLRWVAETGKDPMRCFRQVRAKNVDVTWKFRARKHKDGYAVLVGIGIEGEKWSTLPPKDSSAEFFLLLDGYRIGAQGSPPFMWDDLINSIEIDVLETTDTSLLATFVTQETAATNKDEVRAHTRAQASNELDRMSTRPEWKEALENV